ncbi:hypothetical protein PInf_025530 [Phytophthora infestans]|nr:hypothetical protein PInf_025530 [Phytophthora infestans]
MQFFAPLVALVYLVAGAESACTGPNARTTPPPGAIVVDATGAYRGSFKTVSEGVAKLSTATGDSTLFLMPGIYKEKVTVPPLKGKLIVQGYTCDTTSYSANQVTITRAMAQNDIPASITKNRNDYTTTLLLKSSNVKVYNLNVANTAGNVGQAIAMKIDGANYGIYACKLTGYQDTLYANQGPALFAKSYINEVEDVISQCGFRLEDGRPRRRIRLDSVLDSLTTATAPENSDNSMVEFMMMLDQRQALREAELRREREEREAIREDRERQLRVQLAEQQAARDTQNQQLMLMVMAKLFGSAAVPTPEEST